MAYTMNLADEIQAADEIIEDQGVKILIAPKDLMFLLGTRLDFEADRLQASFTFQNPNQTGACGCGESVSIAAASEARERPFNPHSPDDAPIVILDLMRPSWRTRRVNELR